MTCEKRCGLQAGETRPFFALKKRQKAERWQRWSRCQRRHPSRDNVARVGRDSLYDVCRFLLLVVELVLRHLPHPRIEGVAWVQLFVKSSVV